MTISVKRKQRVVLSLHTAQEDESYIALGDTPGADEQPPALFAATAGTGKAC